MAGYATGIRPFLTQIGKPQIVADMRMGQENAVQPQAGRAWFRAVGAGRFFQRGKLTGEGRRRIKQIPRASNPVDQAQRSGIEVRAVIGEIADLRRARILPRAQNNDFARALGRARARANGATSAACLTR